MNANELADWLENEYEEVFPNQQDIVDMLRQQQAELDAFKLQYYNTGYSIQLRDKDETIRQQHEEIIKLKLEWQYMADLTEKLQDFAIWMTGCGYDFCQHEYFIKCRDELLKGVRNERK